MKNKLIILLIIAIMLTGGALSAFFLLGSGDEPKTDLAALNDIAMTFAESDDGDGMPQNVPDFSYEYTVLDIGGDMVYSVGENAPKSVTDALLHGDIVYDIERGGEYKGKLLVFRDDSAEQENRIRSLVCLGSAVLLTAILCTAYFLYLRRAVFKPFAKMERFAKSVAMGQLDIPAEMDRGNIFGAFTESFDIMRVELKAAREREAESERSKRELVAQLSHDIKTPVASIKAIAEVMTARLGQNGNEHEIAQLAAITAKADQINQLITNLFHAALEELDRLSVNVREEESTIVSEIIAESDYAGKVRNAEIPGCIILCDALRLRQIFDNVISNSYKYAGTDMDVMAEIRDDFLTVILRDYGKGVSENEHERLFLKYYRGENSEGKSGSGLGLYISRYLMEKMGGEITDIPSESGFAVKLSIPLA